MYLIYVDESGDPGSKNGGTPFFVVSGIIVHENHWNEIFQRFLDLRRNLSQRYNKLPQRTPFHATEIVNGHGPYHHSQHGFTTQQRFDYYREILEFLSQLNQVRILNVVIHKQRLNDPAVNVYETAWNFFIQRFSNFLNKGGHLKSANAFGLLVTDRTQDDSLRQLLRKMRAFNFVPSQYAGNPSRKMLVTRILDDPIPRNSRHSYFVQMADMTAFALARQEYPRASLNPLGFQDYFKILEPVLLKEASSRDPLGVVHYPSKTKKPPASS